MYANNESFEGSFMHGKPILTIVSVTPTLLKLSLTLTSYSQNSRACDTSNYI